ncbi:MAG: TOPRIM nucleotidyl transferase/hydrolase domain-containing protein [Streptosporangiaceae bacterium]
MPANPALDGRPRAVVLVEGMSDQLALEVLARRRGRDLAADGVAVIAMHGATNLGRHLERYGPGGLNVKLAGLCDAAEEDYFGRALRRVGIGAGASGAAMEALGFFVCTLDLEDELIRAVGTDAVERIIAAQGELRSLRTLQRQPAQRGRPTRDQLRRFMSGRSGNKHRYARLLADAVDMNQVPRPLDGVLAHV